MKNSQVAKMSMRIYESEGTLTLKSALTGCNARNFGDRVVHNLFTTFVWGSSGCRDIFRGRNKSDRGRDWSKMKSRRTMDFRQRGGRFICKRGCRIVVGSVIRNNKIRRDSDLISDDRINRSKAADRIWITASVGTMRPERSRQGEDAVSPDLESSSLVGRRVVLTFSLILQWRRLVWPILFMISCLFSFKKNKKYNGFTVDRM
jgi:hypothetical protein